MHAKDIRVGYHPDGFRIDTTAAPMNRYTRWTICDDGGWVNPRPVCFHALPEEGWVHASSFAWPKEQEKVV